MSQQKIKATDLERRYLAQHVHEANVAEAIASKLMTMFCEAHGIPGATFVGIDGDSVIVQVPNAQPELVKEA